MRAQRRKFVLASALATFAAATGALAVAKPRVVKVVAKRFVFTPATIKLAKGEPVVFELTTRTSSWG